MSSGQQPRWMVWGAVFLLCIVGFYFLSEGSRRETSELESQPALTETSRRPLPPGEERLTRSEEGTRPAPFSSEEGADTGERGSGRRSEDVKGTTGAPSLARRIARALRLGGKTSGERGGGHAEDPERRVEFARPDPGILRSDRLEPPASGSEPELSRPDGSKDAESDPSEGPMGDEPSSDGSFEVGEPTSWSCVEDPSKCQGFNFGLGFAGELPGIIASRVGDARGFVIFEPGPNPQGEVWILSKSKELLRVPVTGVTTEEELYKVMTRFAP